MNTFLASKLQYHVTGRIVRGEGQAIAEVPQTYQKVRFSSDSGATAGIVLPADKLAAMSISDISRFFPYSEARFMRKLDVSPVFQSWDEAFAFSFPA